MRTDSTRISEIALNEARNYIEENFGKEYLPEKPYIYAAGNLLKMLMKQCVQQISL